MQHFAEVFSIIKLLPREGVTSNLRAFASAKYAIDDFFKESFKKTTIFQVLQRKKS